MLNIKEIFKSDLDPNSTIWWADAKVDKLNYNFNQLILGGPQGPQGNTGYSGDSGARGVQGFQGPVGVQGFQGPQGIAADEPWHIVSDERNVTLMPKYNGLAADEITAIRVVFSDFITSTVDIDGDGTPDEAYSVNAPVKVNDGVFISYVEDVAKNNIEFRTEVAEGLGKRSYINLESAGNDFMIIKSDGKINQRLDYLTLEDSIDGEYLTLKPTNAKAAGLTISSNTRVDQSDVIANGIVNYKNNPSVGMVLAADNATGETSWRLKHEIIGTFPEGSIIAITTNEFNDDNFYLNEFLSSAESNKGFLPIRYGAGKPGTKYEGWYLCNGQTWTDSNNVLEFNVPNLNNFEYQIDANNNGQIPASGGDNSIVLIGGIGLLNDAEYTGTATVDNYTVLQEATYSDESIQLDYNLGSDFYMTRNVHIAYLGQNDLTWNDANGTTPTPTESIYLAGPSSDSTNACAASISEFIWTGIGKTWSNVQEDLTGVILYNANNTPASVKWYAKDNVARYWNGTAFTLVAPCPVQQTIQLGYNQDVTLLNGTVSSSSNYTIDNTSFEFATTLLNSFGFNATAGWYKKTNSSNGARRYWDGTQFVGEVITFGYIAHIGEVEFSMGTSYDICVSNNDIHELYAATNTIFALGGLSDLQSVYNNGATVYVHEGWIGTTPKVHPLVMVRSQNADGQYQPYNGLLDTAGFRSAIQSNSKIYLPQSCF